MINSQFYLKLFTKEGVKLPEITGRANGFLELVCRDPINDAGVLVFTVDLSHPLLNSIHFIPMMQVELWQNNKFLFRGLYIDLVIEDDEEEVSIICIGERGLLNFFDIMYPADWLHGSLFVNMYAENIMKHIIAANTGHLATTANGHLAEIPIAEQIIKHTPVLNRGKLVPSYTCFGKTVLEALQEVAEIGAGDFNLLKKGLRYWELEFYPGQLGEDRTESYIFSKQRQNMFKAVYEIKRGKQKAVVVGAGQGQEDQRLFTPPIIDAKASFYSNKLFDSRNQKTLVGATEAASQYQRENAETKILTFQTSETKLNLGDIALAEYRGETFRQKIVLKEYESTKDEDRITLTLRTVE